MQNDPPKRIRVNGKLYILAYSVQQQQKLQRDRTPAKLGQVEFTITHPDGGESKAVSTFVFTDSMAQSRAISQAKSRLRRSKEDKVEQRSLPSKEINFSEIGKHVSMSDQTLQVAFSNFKKNGWALCSTKVTKSPS